MDFAEPGTQPALFSQKENIEKLLRDYKRNALDYYLAERGSDTYLAKYFGGEKHYQRLPGANDPNLKHFLIVPMLVTPDFTNEYVYEVPKKASLTK